MSSPRSPRSADEAVVGLARREVAMIVQFIDSVAGTPVYINPAYVVTLRPDPADPDHISIIKIRDGESIRVRGGDKEVADKLARAV